jgi:lysyl-tRNA synthetase, class II
MDKHVLMLSDPEPIQLLKTRAKIVRTIRDFFNNRSFTEVQTPILDAAAGGAIARPFETVATEFSNRKLNLRIAPELWLKRLIVGGMSKVFEIGPSFRNEGRSQ